jgi:hypothetical protein
VHVVQVVRDGDQTPSRAQNTGELAERAIDVGHVVEHPSRDHAIE